MLMIPNASRERPLAPDPQWVEWQDTWHAYQEFAQGIGSPNAGDIDLLLARLSRWRNRHFIHLIRVDCDGPVRDLRAADFDADGAVEILGITSNLTAFCLKPPTNAETQWLLATQKILETTDRVPIGVALFEDNLGQINGRFMVGEGERTLSFSAHIRSKPFGFSVSEASRGINESRLIVARQMENGQIASVDVVRAVPPVPGVCAQLRIKPLGKRSESRVRSHRYEILAVLFDEHGIYVSDTSPALMCLSPSTSSVLWTQEQDWQITSLQMSATGELFAASPACGISCINPSDGTTRWNDSTLGDILALDIQTQPSGSSSLLIAGTRDGFVDIYALAPDEQITSALDVLWGISAEYRSEDTIATLTRYMRAQESSLRHLALARAVKMRDKGAEELVASYISDHLTHADDAFDSFKEIIAAFQSAKSNVPWVPPVLAKSYPSARRSAQNALARVAASLPEDRAQSLAAYIAHDQKTLFPPELTTEASPPALLAETLEAHERLLQVHSIGSPASAIIPWHEPDYFASTLLIATSRREVFRLDPNGITLHADLQRYGEQTSRAHCSLAELDDSVLATVADPAGAVEIYHVHLESKESRRVWMFDLETEIRGIYTWTDGHVYKLALWGNVWGRFYHGVWNEGRLALAEEPSWQFAATSGHLVLGTHAEKENLQWIISRSAGSELAIKQTGETNGPTFITFGQEVLAWAILNNRAVIAACPDGFLYCLNASGELQWRRRVGLVSTPLELAQVSSTGSPDIIFGTTDGAIWITNAEGQLIWSRPPSRGQGRPAMVCAFTRESGGMQHRYLIIARCDHLVEWSEILLPSSGVVKSLADAWVAHLNATSAEAKAKAMQEWSSRPGGSAAYWIAAATNDPVGSWFLHENPPSQQATPTARSTYVGAVAARLARETDRLLEHDAWKLLNDELDPDSQRVLLRALPPCVPNNAQQKTLEHLACYSDHEVARAATRWMRRSIRVLGDSAAFDSFLPMLSAACHPDACNDTLEEIAGIIADLWRLSPDRGWRLAFGLATHGAAPYVFSLLAQSNPPRLREPTARSVFVALATWTRAFKSPVPDAFPDSIAPLGELAAALETFNAVTDTSAQVLIYLRELSRVTTPEHIFDLFGADPLYASTIAALKASPVSFPDLMEPLLQVQLMIPEQVRRHPHRSVAYVDSLRLFSKRLDEWSRQPDVAPSIHIATPDWRSLVMQITRRWVRSDGVLAERIYTLEHEFAWEINLIMRPRWTEGQDLSVHLRITNTGRVTADSLALANLQLRAGDTDLPVSHSFPSSPKPFAPGQTISFLVRVRVAYELLRRKPHLDLVLTLSYFGPPRRETPSQCISIPVSIGAGLQIEFPREFPRAWERLGKETRRQLRSRQGVLLVEIERGARRSVLNEMLGMDPNARPIVVDLRDVYRDVLNSNRLSASELHVSLGRLLWTNQPDLQADIEGGFRDAYLRHLRASESPNVLLLDNFDYLMRKLMETDDGRKALDETLQFWHELIEDPELKFQNLRLVLGGSYLTAKILELYQPEFFKRMFVLHANDVTADPRETAEAVDFLRRTLDARHLSETLALFSPAVTPRAVVELCGGNLHYLRAFGIDALDQARIQAQSEKQRLQQTELVNFWLSFARDRNFFCEAWVWLPFYEELLLTLIAQADFTLTSKQIHDGIGLQFSREHYSLSPQGRRSKLLAKPDEMLTDDLASTISKDDYLDKYFPDGGVALWGVSSRRPLGFQQDASSRMLWHVLEGAGRDSLLNKLKDEGILTSQQRGDLGEVWTFAVPLMGRWFRKNGVYKRLILRARGENVDWAPSELWDDQRPEMPKGPIYEKRTFVQSIPRHIPWHDLGRIDRAITTRGRDDERPLFLNLYGIGSRVSKPVERWKEIIELERALSGYLVSPFPPSQATTTAIFEGLQKLFSIIPADPPAAGMPFGPTAFPTANDGLVWQYSSFVEFWRRFNKEMLVGVIHKGAAFMLSDIRTFVDAAYRILRAQIPNSEHEVPTIQNSRLVAVLLILDNFEEFKHAWDVENAEGGAVHYVLVDPLTWAETCAAADPRNYLREYVRTQVGWAVFSPYQYKGNLLPGSPFFVGRKKEIEQICAGIQTRNYAIVGSRQVGKTSLLLRIIEQLKQDSRLCVLDVGSPSSAGNFIERVAEQVPSAYREPFMPGDNSYEPLRRMCRKIVEGKNQLPILTIDEADEFYARDLNENSEKFFSFLRELTQSSPRFASIILTGYQRIYFAIHDPEAKALYNFCEPINIAEVEPDSARRLIDFLPDELGIEFYNHRDAVALLLDRTYCVPFILQKACHGLLVRLTQTKRVPPRLEKADLEGVLTRAIDQELYDELFKKLAQEGKGVRATQALRPERIQIMLLATILGQRLSRPRGGSPYRRPDAESESFMPEQVVGYLDQLARELKGYWIWTTEEIDSYLRDLTLTLAIGRGTDARSYHFPLNILPSVLERMLQGRSDEKISTEDILEHELRDKIEHYRDLVEIRRKTG